MKALFLSIVTLFTFSVFAQNKSQIGIELKVEELLTEYSIQDGPGIAISVAQDGNEIYKKNMGYSNLEHMIQITDSSKFVVGSISKQFTAFSILLLEEEGKLSIDDDIRKYLPELNDLPHRITIKHFMNHTSGFRDNTDLNSLKGRTDLDRTSQMEMVDLLLRQKGLNFEPGARFQYSNSGYVLLAEIVARVSGETFVEFVKKRIFEPLKMENSLFLDDPSLVVKNKALSYFKQNDAYFYIPLNRSVVGSTGLYTTVHDLSLWANNFDNRIIGSEAILEKMATKSDLNNDTVIPYALGQEVKKYKGLDVIFHGGGDAGFRSYLLRVPEHKLNIAISGNFDAFNPLNISYGLIDIFLSSYTIEPVQKQLPDYSNSDLLKYVGDYQVFPGYYVTISAKQDSLFFQSYGSDSKLNLPVLGKDEFEFPARAHSKFKFIQGGLYWHFSDFYYPAKLVTLDPPKYSELDLQEFTGTYNSDEIETYYEIKIENNKLIATHNFNDDAELSPICDDSFITDLSFIGRLEFIRDAAGNIDGCKVSGQNTNDILFTKSE